MKKCSMQKKMEYLSKHSYKGPKPDSQTFSTVKREIKDLIGKVGNTVSVEPVDYNWNQYDLETQFNTRVIFDANPNKRFSITYSPKSGKFVVWVYTKNDAGRFDRDLRDKNSSIKGYSEDATKFILNSLGANESKKNERSVRHFNKKKMESLLKESSYTYYIDMYSRRGYPMGRVSGSTIKDVVDQAGEQMDWLSKAAIRRMVKKSSNTEVSMSNESKKNERSVRHFTNRIESLAEQEFVDMAAIGEYMLTAFSEDKIEQAYDWMERDEMIPSEEELEENEIEFSDTDTRKYTNRIIDLVDMEYLTYKEIGEYLLRAFSEDDIEKLYSWLEQDEMIPSEEELRDEYELEFDYDGELVSVGE